MAGKHSKSIFDFRKNVFVAHSHPQAKDYTPISLPFKRLPVLKQFSITLLVPQ